MTLQDQVAQGVEVPQALRHLLAFDQEEAHVEPETGEGLSRERFRLCDLVFMVREDEIFSPGVQVEALAQFLHRHDGALQVPTGASRPDRSIPGSLTRLGRLPQRKVAGAVFVIFVNVYAGSVEHPAEIFLREFPILRKLRDAEIIRPIVGAVGNPLLD